MTNTTQKQREVDLKDFKQNYDKLSEIINKTDFSKIDMNTKKAIITVVKKTIEQHFKLLQDYGEDALSYATEGSKNPQHNTIPPRRESLMPLGFIRTVKNKPTLMITKDFGVSLDASTDKEFIDKTNKLLRTRSNKEVVYRDQIDTIANKLQVDKDVAKEIHQSIQSFSGGDYLYIRAAEQGQTVYEDKYGSREITPIVDRHRQDAKNIDKFLRGFEPKFKGTIYRGIIVDPETKQQIIDLLNKGEFEHPAMSSYSSSKDIAKVFVEIDAEDPETKDLEGLIFVGKNKSGVSIRNISLHDREDEVLIPKGARIKMSGEPYIKDGITYIPIEEID